MGGYNAVHFFRKGRCKVERAQAGFNVRHRDAGVERTQSTGQRCGGVALHDSERGLHLQENLLKPGNQPRGEGGQSLARLHQIEIEIGRDSEYREHLIEHLAVLGRDADKGIQMGLLPKNLDERAKLDRFRPRAKDHQNARLVLLLLGVDFTCDGK